MLLLILKFILEVNIQFAVDVSLDVQSSRDNSMTADITSHDADGRIYTRIKGATVTVSKQLNQLFARAV